MDKLHAELSSECARLEEALVAEDARLAVQRSEASEQHRRRAAAEEDLEKVERAAAECIDACASMKAIMDGANVEDAEAAAAAELLAEKQGVLAATQSRVDTLQHTVTAEEKRLRDEADAQRKWLNAAMREIESLQRQCADAEAGERYIDARCRRAVLPSTTFLDDLEPFLDGLTSEREASYRDLAQDLMVRIDEAEELDRAVGQIQDANKARREQTIAAAHDFANQLTSAFDVERERFVASYRTSATRNAELRHHLHRGTHNARPTQLTERERKALQKQHDTAEELHGVRQQLEAVRAEIHELDRRAETTLKNSKASDEAFEKARARHREDLKEGRTFIRMLEREGAQWACAKSDLELLLKYSHAGAIPDRVAQPKWKLAVIARRNSRMTSAAASVRSGAASTVADDDDEADVGHLSDDDNQDAPENAKEEEEHHERTSHEDKSHRDSTTGSSSRPVTPDDESGSIHPKRHPSAAAGSSSPERAPQDTAATGVAEEDQDAPSAADEGSMSNPVEAAQVDTAVAGDVC